MMLVSIITPSYNQAPFLEQTMRSVLDQDYLRIEYMVIDGGSTDGSVELIKKHADRLAFWVSEKDRGQADAINKGFAHAHGEIVAWLNSDDYYLPDAVAEAVKAFEENPAAAMVYGDMLAVDGSSRTFNKLTYCQLSLDDLLCFEIIGQPAVFMRRAALEAVGGLDTRFHCMLDHQLWIKLACQGEIVHIGRTLAAARFHPAAKNRRIALQFGVEAFRLAEWAGADPELRPLLVRLGRRARASVHRVDARYKLDAGQPTAALAAWSRAFWIYPPVALARLNIFGSAMLDLTGLGRVRAAVLDARRRSLQKHSGEG